MFESTETDELARVIHKRNIVCSERLLRALRHNHSACIEKCGPEPKPAAPEPEPIPEPINAQDPIVPELVAPVIFATNKIERIKRAVCKHYSVSKSDIESSSRKKGVAFPRQIAFYLTRTHTPYSLPEIGRRFGGRDHSTILYAFHKIKSMAATDPALAVQLDEIIAELPA